LTSESSKDEDEIHVMKKAWEYLSPPNKEADLVGKWFAVCFAGKRSKNLYIAKMVSQFLIDEDGL